MRPRFDGVGSTVFPVPFHCDSKDGLIRHPMKFAVLILFAVSLPMIAQEQPGTKMFKLSVAALAASTTFDLATSIADSGGCGRTACHETNALLTNASGGFSTPRAIGVKAGINGGLVVAEILLLKKYPRLRHAFSIVNFGDAGIYTYSGVHNLDIRQ